MLLLESEIDLLKLSFPQLNQPVSIFSHKSKVYFIPDPKRLGIDSMGEFAVSFELSGQFLNEEGKPAPLILISETLERAFNFSFGDIYKSKTRIFSRKPFNLTKALDHLKTLLIRESQDKDKTR
ncbi:hypothetical protein [Porphyromonas macacae]|uniref:hypothetical protein n=1 Tax=Porphyromonas macacae TaxID=28115 RepID=UPI0024AD10E1|nr:hypothetical protein [Porphyromonas macacae]